MNPGSWKRLLPWPKNERPTERNLRLQGRLVVLREKRIGDVEADFAWRVDPELASLDATSPLRLSLKEYTCYFRDELEYPSPWSVRLAVDTLGGEHIGNVMYYDADFVKGQAERTRTVPEGVPLARRERVWFELVEALMNDLNGVLDRNIRVHFARYIR